MSRKATKKEADRMTMVRLGMIVAMIMYGMAERRNNFVQHMCGLMLWMDGCSQNVRKI